MKTRLLILAIILLTSVSIIKAGTIYVDISAAGSNDGSSWVNAYTQLQSALDAAVSGDEIWVAKGTYLPSTKIGGTSDRDKAFQMKEGVSIYGGFAGNESAISLRTDDGFGETNETILSGDFNDNDAISGSGSTLSISNNSENAYHVFHHPSGYTLTANAVLDGFTIKGGFAGPKYDPAFEEGGAIFNQAGQSPIINNCYFIGNEATDQGGAIKNASSANAIITNCTFTKNMAGFGRYGEGGAIANISSNVTITNCLFVENSANDGLYDRGGAIYNGDASNATITNCSFVENYAKNGGGIYNRDNSNPVIKNCIIWGNTIYSGGEGTQVRNDNNSDPIFAYCDIEGGWNGSGVENENDCVPINGGGNINSDPEFTGTTLNPSHPYSLIGNSPCADVGDNTANSQTYDIRQADFGRKLDKAAAAGTIDIGAYEYKYGVDYAGNNMIFVDADATGNNNGTTWANAYISFQDAITASTSGQEIWVAEGTYYPSFEVGGTGDRNQAFQMKNGVTYYGGFAGTETAASERTDYGSGAANETILSGDIGIVDDNSDNCYHVFYHPDGSGIDNTAIMDGFTITKGNTSFGYPNGLGGGMFNKTSSPTITNCIFINNNSSAGGGGMYNEASSPILTDCSFKENISSMNGGALFNYDTSSPTISNCTFIGNSADADGGGLYDWYLCNSIINNCTFSGNTADEGGAMYIRLSTSTIINTILWDNTAITSGNEIYIEESTTLISYCNIEGSGGSSSWDTGLGTDSGNNIDADPRFVGSGDDPYLIYGISPCADAGDNSVNAETTDIRGGSFGRKLSKTDSSAGTIDMGAYEYKFGVDPPGEYPPIYVDISASGNNDGSSWTNAYTSLQSALDAADNDDEIWVAKGIYKPSEETDGSTDTPREFTFQMIDGVEIYGGFAGIETATSQRIDYGIGETNETILSGDFNDDDVVSGSGLTLSISNNTENSYHLFYHLAAEGLTSAAILDGFTISGGNANSSWPNNCGGGMFNNTASPSVNNCTFIGNSVTENGGGIYNYNSASPSVSNCTFSKNSVKYGGGINNTSLNTNPNITNCIFSGNLASFYGGGIHNSSNSAPSATNCNFSGNHAGQGGGMFTAQSTAPVLTNCVFVNNSTQYDGGGLNITTCSPDIINCTFSQNTASRNGGGIFVSNTPSIPNIKNTIVWGNTASASGNNIYINADSNPTFYNCDIEGSGGSSSWAGATYGTDGGNNIDSDPHFADQGGDDFRLTSYSPCADVGDNSANSETNDIRGSGYARKLNKTTGAAGTIDMGAYEFLTGTDPDYASTTWTGTESTAWNTKGNWSGSNTPTMYYNIIIPNVANDPNIASGASGDCTDLTINSGAILTLESGGSFITAGTITNNGTFNAKRSISNGQWHMISSPLVNAQSGMFAGDYLQEWNETTGLWSDISSTTAALTPAKGFSFWSNGTGSTTHTFTGTPNTGAQSLSLSTSGSGGSYEDANLLGNPYPSSIDWALLDGAENGAVYCYNGTGYLNWNNGSGTGSQYIAPMQGFFIIAPSAGTFNIDNSDRVHNGAANYYKSTNTVSHGLVLAASNGTYNDELWIAFNETANAEFDYAYDAYKFFSGNSGIAQLYTITDDNHLSIDIRPETDEIQLGFRNDQSGVYQIGISQINGIGKVELEDTKLNTFHNLNNGTYDFDWSTIDSEDRFILHLKATATQEFVEQESQVYSSNGQIYIRQTSSSYFNSVVIYDIAGRVIYSGNLNQDEMQSISLSNSKGAYLVQLMGENVSQTEKVILK